MVKYEINREMRHDADLSRKKGCHFSYSENTIVQIFIIQYNIIVSVCIGFPRSILQPMLAARHAIEPVDAGHLLR